MSKLEELENRLKGPAQIGIMHRIDNVLFSHGGHTPVEKIVEKDGIILTDVFSTYRDGRQIGESAMIVIDSETGEYEKVEVMGKQGV